MSQPSVKLGGTIDLVIVATTTSDVPTAASSAPTVDIFGDISKTAIESNLASVAKSGYTGVYYLQRAITAARGYAAGQIYTAVFAYSVGSDRRQVVNFMVR